MRKKKDIFDQHYISSYLSKNTFRSYLSDKMHLFKALILFNQSCSLYTYINFKHKKQNSKQVYHCWLTVKLEDFCYHLILGSPECILLYLLYDFVTDFCFEIEN